MKIILRSNDLVIKSHHLFSIKEIVDVENVLIEVVSTCGRGVHARLLVLIRTLLQVRENTGIEHQHYRIHWRQSTKISIKVDNNQI